MRKQRAFKDLTDAEVEQIAEWLQHGKYDDVRERVAKPRDQGGFGLIISNKPLQLLWAKKNIVRKINDKLESGERLTIAQLEAINAAEKPDLSEKVHDAILETTYDIVMEGGNSPSRLVSLQRLADFPARAEIRARREQMTEEVHAWKRESHAWKAEHLASRKELTAIQKRILEIRLALAQQAVSAVPNRNLTPTLFPPSNEDLVQFDAQAGTA